MITEEKNLTTWREAFLVYTKPRVIGLFFLGFSAGLPFLLVFSTLSAWLRDIGISRTTIGFFSWVGITFSIKFLWAPIIDRLPFPVLTRLFGRRRGWMLASQLGIAIGLSAMAITNPIENITLFALLALLVAFSSATQDICIDAYRIEAADNKFQGAMAATYVLGYRVALLVGGAGALYIAEYQSWTLAYLTMASLMLIGVITTLIIKEPDHIENENAYKQEARVIAFLENNVDLNPKIKNIYAWFIGAVICPFVDFFNRNAKLAFIILLFIGLYRISDITMGVMANPFYIDLGFSKKEIADVGKIFGFFMTILGSAIGGILVMRFGVMKPLLLGAILVAITNLLFAYMANVTTSINLLALVISADNLSGGIAVSAFIAYLSGLTNTAYTATQYALFSSLMTLPAKVIAGFSGIVVDIHGYTFFFTYASALGIPAILLVVYLIYTERQTKQLN